MITIQRQPNGSKTCGQHCIAMIADIPVKEVIDIFGHARSSVTKDYVKAFAALGINHATRFKRYKWKKDLPKLCIIRMLWIGHKDKGHVAVYHNGFIYCSSVGVRPYNRQYFIDVNCRPVSYLKIEKA